MRIFSNRFAALFTFACCCALLLLAGCGKNSSTTTRMITLQTPVLAKKSDVLGAINGNASEPIVSAGKIFTLGKYIFLNDPDKGIHIIDNSNPVNPIQTAFLNIPGNLDIAVKGNILYADLYADLLSLDISDVHRARVVDLLPNVFMSRAWLNGYVNSDTSQLVTGWITKDTLVEDISFPPGIFYAMNASGQFNKSSAGKGGSMARMTLMNDYLYAISESHSMTIINVREASAPRNIGVFNAGFDLETIYPFDNKLFLGSSVGMFMYDMSNPEQPATLGQFAHGRACDPVVTDGEYAYVTLHSGTMCGGSANELNVIDIHDLQNPTLLKSYPLTSPGGLSKDGNLVFICDGKDGIKLFNAADPGDLKLLQVLSCKDPYDIIAENDHAIVVAADGIHQYDYSNTEDIRTLSVIKTSGKK